ncbi:hypothetical protein EC973_003547 [Apophysomyces ossiformis]|uniref:Heterokaryon incompatibility domain-containing protein n=1 Tax=Apophysomyces ossiformis TaxID=679940 RepID=A0A8H7EN03_9FUNG|nr:hypothetical protein EC973_003547 [Apophysomyces ossiformis]
MSEIVLLDTLSDLNDIKCISVPFDEDVPEYYAVSYRWGVHPEWKAQTPNYDASITSISQENLIKLCLLYQRKIRYLWIDVVCINQADKKHRKMAIKNMDNFYRQAKRIIAVPDLCYCSEYPLMGDVAKSDIDLALYEIRKKVSKVSKLDFEKAAKVSADKAFVNCKEESGMATRETSLKVTGCLKEQGRTVGASAISPQTSAANGVSPQVLSSSNISPEVSVTSSSRTSTKVPASNRTSSKQSVSAETGPNMPAASNSPPKESANASTYSNKSPMLSSNRSISASVSLNRSLQRLIEASSGISPSAAEQCNRWAQSLAQTERISPCSSLQVWPRPAAVTVETGSMRRVRRVEVHTIELPLYTGGSASNIDALRKKMWDHTGDFGFDMSLLRRKMSHYQLNSDDCVSNRGDLRNGREFIRKIIEEWAYRCWVVSERTIGVKHDKLDIVVLRTNAITPWKVWRDINWYIDFSQRELIQTILKCESTKFIDRLFAILPHSKYKDAVSKLADDDRSINNIKDLRMILFDILDNEGRIMLLFRYSIPEHDFQHVVPLLRDHDESSVSTTRKRSFTIETTMQDGKPVLKVSCDFIYSYPRALGEDFQLSNAKDGSEIELIYERPMSLDVHNGIRCYKSKGVWWITLRRRPGHSAHVRKYGEFLMIQ